MLMKKAERFTAKRNYYLARKALRHAQALGADEIVVKERLREIRKLEFPEGLYNTMSSDQSAAKVDTGEVLDRLELEFDLTEGAGDSAELSAVVELRIDAILEENDPRTILDFGVGLHEMGLFKQAEALFIRVVEEYPDYAFDAYYLAATSKLSRRDYAGAASILKRLSSDNSKTDLEKIQIYYALGETFEKMRQTDRSKKFFKKVAELDSNYRNIRQKKLDG
jgi:TolA-binding protein